MIDIEIDGKAYQAEPGSMIIQVADNIGIPIPRFCYHKKLSIAANCRMCLVEVEKAPKPLPACATPIAPGMKISTNSAKAKEAQRSVMEFLLINHPLDCPICDQGGECELQDVSLVYGADQSRYIHGKRSVKDDNLGPLIATEMTRCIQCTRCVRFGQEIAGLRELGAIGRNENLEITTYVKHSMESELSGNIIDLCPVGALTSKPFRFQARAWELEQTASIAPHDCVGSNVYIHTLNQKVMRVAPHENETLNEMWLSDRDRFSYLGIQGSQRLHKPMLKIENQWQEVDWPTAFAAVVSGLTKVKDEHGAKQIAALASPSSTLEEFYLLQRIMRSLDSNNIDHRLHQTDFADQDCLPLYPKLDLSLAELQNQDTIVLIGSNVQREQPIIGHRIRKATLKATKVLSLNVIDYPFNFNQQETLIIKPEQMVQSLAGIAKVLVDNQQTEIPKDLKDILQKIQPSKAEQNFASYLIKDKKITLLLGAIAQNHPQAAAIRTFSKLIADILQGKIGYLTEGANSAGAWLAGAIPHRTTAGAAVAESGFTAHEMLAKKLKAYLLLNIEPELDCANSTLAREALEKADLVIAMTPFKSASLIAQADILLPIATFAETSGTLVNVQGLWQSFSAAVNPPDESRPAWKVLRVMANQLQIPNFNYATAEQIRDEIQQTVNQATAINEKWFVPKLSAEKSSEGLTRITEWPIYAVDNLVRHSTALQEAASNDPVAIVINEKLAKRYGFTEGKEVTVAQNGCQARLPIIISSRIPDDCVLLHGGRQETAGLGQAFGAIEIYA